MSFSEYVSQHVYDIGIAVLGIIAGLVGVWWGNRNSRKLARESGSLKTRSLGLFAGKQEIREAELWCYCIPEHSADTTCVAVEVMIVNKGELTCDGVVLTLETAKDLLSSYSPKKGHPTHKIHPAVLEDDYKRAVGDRGLFRHVSYKLPPIGPRSALGLEEYIFLTPTVEAAHSFDCTTKDNVNVEFQCQASWSWPMTISVIATDCEPEKVRLEIYGITATTFEEALQKLRRVAAIPQQEQPRSGRFSNIFSRPRPLMVPMHHVRLFMLNEFRRETLEGKKVVLFEAAELMHTVLFEDLRSLSMQPKAELLNMKKKS